jgi:hypothetical protein
MPTEGHPDSIPGFPCDGGGERESNPLFPGYEPDVSRFTPPQVAVAGIEPA